MDEAGGKNVTHLEGVGAGVLFADDVAVVGPKQLKGAFDTVGHCAFR